MISLLWAASMKMKTHKITKYQDAIAVLEDVTIFLDSKGHFEEATKLSSTMNMLTKLHTVSRHHRQSTLQKNSSTISKIILLRCTFQFLCIIFILLKFIITFKFQTPMMATIEGFYCILYLNTVHCKFLLCVRVETGPRLWGELAQN